MLRVVCTSAILLAVGATPYPFGGFGSGACGCTSDETCCADDKGYTCCIDQGSFCVPKELGDFPSRCCPQWTVGCQVGSVGCCDPANPWTRSINSEGGALMGTHTEPSDSPNSSTAAPNSSTTVYALFSSSTGSDKNCVTIDGWTGEITSKVPVSGPAKGYFDKLYGGATRVYPFSQTRQKFYFVDVVPRTGATAESPITLFSVDPITCGSTAATVTGGASGPVLGFQIHAESDRMVRANATAPAPRHPHGHSCGCCSNRFKSFLSRGVLLDFFFFFGGRLGRNRPRWWQLERGRTRTFLFTTLISARPRPRRRG